MPAITLPGIQTGIDTRLLIQSLVATARQPIAKLEARKAAWEKKQSAFSQLQTHLDSLKRALADLRYAADLRTYTARSSNEEVLTLQTASGASEGAHAIVINQLAAAERKVHDGIAALDDPALIGAGAFAYTYDGETRIVHTTTTTTLEGLRDLINNDGGNPGVTASILQYDAGEGRVYHLVLSGNDTGSAYAVAVDDENTSLDAFKSATFTYTQAARDAQVRVNGYPDGQWISRSSNTIDDVLPGVTLELHSAGAANISLTRDTAGLKRKIQDFVTAYNTVVTYVQQQVDYDETTKKAGILMGEYTTTHTRERLRLPLIEAALGFTDTADTYLLATQIGLSLDRYGQLKLDEKTFDEALSENYLGVLNLLGANRTGSSDSSNLKFYGAADSTTAGTYHVRATFAAGVLQSAQIKLATEGDDAWRDAAVQDNLIIGVEGNSEQWLQVTANYSGSGTIQAVVRVRQGIGGRLYDAVDDLLDASDGSLAMARKRCTGAIEALQKNIQTQEQRLQKMEARLTLQFAKLEQALALMQSQRMALGLE